MKPFRWICILGMTALALAGCIAGNRLSANNSGIRLTLDVPNATRVMLKSSLNRYEGIGMKRNQSGIWEIRMPSDQEFTYFFDVDGVTMLNDCQLTETDEWGGRLCVHVAGEVP